MQAARRAGGGAAERDDVGGGQRGGDGLAFQCGDGLVVELDCDGSAGGAYGRVLKSHCHVRLIGEAMLPGDMVFRQPSATVSDCRWVGPLPNPSRKGGGDYGTYSPSPCGRGLGEGAVRVAAMQETTCQLH